MNYLALTFLMKKVVVCNSPVLSYFSADHGDHSCKFGFFIEVVDTIWWRTIFVYDRCWFLLPKTLYCTTLFGGSVCVSVQFSRKIFNNISPVFIFSHVLLHRYGVYFDSNFDELSWWFPLIFPKIQCRPQFGILALIHFHIFILETEQECIYMNIYILLSSHRNLQEKVHIFNMTGPNNGL